MTKLYYSALPPEVQDTIQKLTGSTAKELENEQGGKPASRTTRTSRAKHKPLETQADRLLAAATTILFLFGIVFICATLATCAN